MKITKEKIKDIAQDLQIGMAVYINRETSETESLLDQDNVYGEPEFWEEEIEKIEKEWKDYVVLTKMSSSEAYQIMEDFVDEVNDERLKEYLIKILNRRSPFANFKAEIDESDYREKWFEFKDKRYEEYVREELLENDFEIE